MKYLRNEWYLAAWATELGSSSPLPRTIIEEPLVFFRDARGAAVALLDRCPHRFAPLSRGKVEGGLLHCGYHGLGFGPDGGCAHNPHGPVPRSARARAFPVIERHGAIWVWMGEVGRADPESIPDFGFIDRVPPESRVTGRLCTAANYLLMVDNIMDLTHADFLHADTLGGGINTRTKGKVTETADGVSIKWHATNELLPPAQNAFLPQPGQRADFHNEVYWSPPGNMRQRVYFGPTGKLAEQGIDSWTAHVMTPQSPGSTHYFFCHTNDLLTRNPRMAPDIEAILLKAFQEEDAPMLEAQQQRVGDADFWSLSPALLSIDGGAVAARRLLDRRLAAEAGSDGR